VLSLEGESGLPLGIVEGVAYGEVTVSLEPCDLLLLYTDGITEVMAPAAPDPETGVVAAREMFGVERLDALLLDCGGSDAEGCVTRVRTEVAAFAENAPPKDDQTLIALKCRA
jgi:sigma-B regulation protein RsbU (phosphoserine phosphatase)